MKPLADYVHSKGLKFGLYTSVGKFTCQNYTGSRGYEAIDAATFADWGVDLLKNDYCNSDIEGMIESATAMRDALNATGRRIVNYLPAVTRPKVWDPMAHSLSPRVTRDGSNFEEQFAPKLSNMWNSWHDIKDYFWSLPSPSPSASTSTST